MFWSAFDRDLAEEVKCTAGTFSNNLLFRLSYMEMLFV